MSFGSSKWTDVPGTYSAGVALVAVASGTPMLCTVKVLTEDGVDLTPAGLDVLMADDHEFELVVEFTSSGYSDPGVTSGPPERCYPPEGDDERVLSDMYLLADWSEEARAGIEGSIRKWERILLYGCEDDGPRDCPLCLRYIANSCSGCPIDCVTEGNSCDFTPYASWSLLCAAADTSRVGNSRELRRLAGDELEFLRGLRSGRIPVGDGMREEVWSILEERIYAVELDHDGPEEDGDYERELRWEREHEDEIEATVRSES